MCVREGVGEGLRMCAREGIEKKKCESIVVVLRRLVRKPIKKIRLMTHP